MDETIQAEERIDAEEARFDGTLVNAVTGLGTAKDKDSYYFVRPTRRLSDSELEMLYSDPLCRRVVDIYAESAVSKEPTIKLSEEEENYDETIKTFEGYLEDLEFYFYVEEALKLSRLYGGAAIFMVLDDGLEPSEPVVPARVRGVSDLVPLSKREIIPSEFNYLDYRNPEFYRISTSKSVDRNNDLDYLLVHNSRVLRFDGLFLPWRQRLNNNGWGESVLQVFWEVWKRYRGATDGMATMLQEMDLFVHKIPGLMSKVSAGNEKALRNRLEANALARSQYGGMALDTEEEVSFASRSLGGSQDIFDRLVDDLVAAADMPKTLLFGTSPAGGLSESGKYEQQTWAQSVERYQQHSLKRALNQFFTLLFMIPAGPTKGVVPQDWAINFPPYYSESEKDKADLRKAVAETDEKYIQMGVLTPLEIRQSRYSGAEYTLETTLVEEEEQRLQLKAELEQEGLIQGYLGQQEALRQQQEFASQPVEQPRPQQEVTDSDDFIQMNGLTLVAGPSNGRYRVGHFVHEDGQRNDSEEVVLIGNRFNDHKVYRGYYQREDSTMEPGPLLLGFYSSRSANKSFRLFAEDREISGVQLLDEADIEHLKSTNEYP